MGHVKSSLFPILLLLGQTFSTSFSFMSTKSATNYLPETSGADLDVTVSQNAVDSHGLRWKFASSSKMQRGDFYMAQSLGLLQRIFPMIGHHDQERLWAAYTRLVQTTQA
jgi:hypothetical protein